LVGQFDQHVASWRGCLPRLYHKDFEWPARWQGSGDPLARLKTPAMALRLFGKYIKLQG
jgi:hypothetical protein